MPGPRVDRYPYDVQVLRKQALRGFFRVAPFQFLGTDRATAARQLDVSGDHPLQIASGFVLVLIENKRALGHLVVMTVESGRAKARAWLKGRGSTAEVYLGKAIGSLNGRVLYQFMEHLTMQELSKLAIEAEEVAELFEETILQKARKPPQDPTEFNRLVAMLDKRLLREARGADADVLRNIVKELSGKATPEQLTRAINDAIRRFETVPPKIDDPQDLILKRQGRRLSIDTRKGIRAKHKLNISTKFKLADRRVTAHLRKSHVNFVRDEYGKRSEAFSKLARDIVAKGQARGLGMKEIEEKLFQTLAAKNFNRSRSYWNVVASVFTNRSRTFASFNSYKEALVTLFEVISVMDEDTTDICRFMNGKILDLNQALSNFQAQTDLSDPLDVKITNPWIRQISTGAGNPPILATRPPSGEGGSRVTNRLATIASSGLGTQTAGNYTNSLPPSGLQSRGVHGPPYHGDCRTDTSPVLRSV